MTRASRSRAPYVSEKAVRAKKIKEGETEAAAAAAIVVPAHAAAALLGELGGAVPGKSVAAAVPEASGHPTAAQVQEVGVELAEAIAIGTENETA